MQTRHTMAELNALSVEDFVRMVGPVFENSPWIPGNLQSQAI